MCLVRGWPKITTQSCEEKQGQQEQRWGFRPQLKTLRPGDPLNNCPPPANHPLFELHKFPNQPQPHSPHL